MAELLGAPLPYWLLLALMTSACVLLAVALLRIRRGRARPDSSESEQGILDSLIEGVIQFRPVFDSRGLLADFVYERITPEAARVLGAPVSEVEGDSLLRRFPSVRQTGDWERLLTAWQGSAPGQYEISYRADGLERDFVYRVWRRGDRLMVAVQDMTRLRGAERRMEQSEGLFREVFRSAPVALALADPSSQSEIAPIIECNELFARNHGYTREDLIGRSIGVVQLDPYTRETLAARVHALKESGGLVDRRLSRKRDGTITDLLVYARIVNVGGRELILGANLDMTQEYLANAARKEAETTLRVLFDTVPLMVGLAEFLGEDVRFIHVNSRYAQRWGRRPEDFEGRLASSLQVAPASLRLQLDNYRVCIEENRVVDFEIESNGRTFSGRLAPVATEDGCAPRVCFLIEDITDRRRVERELALGRKLRSIGEMAAGMAHELNNQLAPALLSLDLIIGDDRLSPTDRDALVTIRQALQRTVDLNRRVLGFGRRTESRTGVCLLEDAVRSAVELMAPAFNRRIHVEPKLHATRTPVLADRDEMIQIVVNLMINARDTLVERMRGETPAWTPVIEIETQEVAAGMQRLTVRDNGMGIPEPVRERLFEPFFTTKGPDSGTGLGLATVWHAVHRAGGRIEFETRQPGGTAFHVHLRTAPPS